MYKMCCWLGFFFSETFSKQAFASEKKNLYTEIAAQAV